MSSESPFYVSKTEEQCQSILGGCENQEVRNQSVRDRKLRGSEVGRGSLGSREQNEGSEGVKAKKCEQWKKSPSCTVLTHLTRKTGTLLGSPGDRGHKGDGRAIGV